MTFDDPDAPPASPVATPEERREIERRKYLQLEPTGYGGTNHGAGALPEVLALHPRFVVDFGCGRNDFIRELRDHGIAGVGVDFANSEADLFAPMHAVPLRCGLGDLIVSFDALEHLLPEDVDLVLDEMRRIAVSGGKFLFSICTRPSRITVGGSNLHPTVQPMAWWLERIARVGKIEKVDRYVRGIFQPEEASLAPGPCQAPPGIPAAICGSTRTADSVKAQQIVAPASRSTPRWPVVPRSLAKDSYDAKSLWTRVECDETIRRTAGSGYFPYFYNVDGMPVWLNATNLGQSAFLLASGPSARELDLTALA